MQPNYAGLNLVRFECGCVGQQFHDGSSHALVWRRCESDRADGPFEAIGFETRDMTGKASVPMRDGDVLTLMQAINSLIGDGKRARAAREFVRAIGYMGPTESEVHRACNPREGTDA